MPACLYIPFPGAAALSTYPLDLGSGPSGGWSTRKLATAYAGNCLKVRRSSDNTASDIGFVGDLLDTASLDTFVGANNGFLDTMYDQSGNSRSMLQATQSLQPQVTNAGAYYTDIGGKVGIEYGGTRYIETSVAQSSLISGAAGTIYAVWLADTAISTGDGNTIWGNAGGWNGTLIKTISGTPNIRIYGFDGNEDFVTVTGFATATAYVSVWTHNAGTLYSYVNNSTAIGSVVHGTENTLTAHMRIGGTTGTSAGSTIFDGRIIEVATFNVAHTATEITNIGSAMATYYGLTWT